MFCLFLFLSIGVNYLVLHDVGVLLDIKLKSQRARNRLNEVVEAKWFEGVHLFRKVC